MAVFLINSCKFGSCGLSFGTLGELIHHIEESHIDLDQQEKQDVKQPTHVALSRVLRFYGDGSPKKPIAVKKSRQRNNSVLSSSASIRSLTPTSSEYDFEEEGLETYGGGIDSDDSRDSWTVEQEFTSQLILSMMSNKNEDYDKPYCCPLKGCKKRYKNINGVKYHARHGHKREAKLAKMQKCFCGKSFHSMKQLGQHTASVHKINSSDHTLIGESLIADDVIQQQPQPSEHGLSIVRPITISAGVILSTPQLQAKQVQAVSKSDFLLAQAVASKQNKVLAGGTVGLIAVSRENQQRQQKQQQIDATVARALAAAKQASAAASVSK